MMIRIGEFAKRAKVSVATLRLYDEQGLLRPVHVEPASGYRFYRTDQLPTLHRIQTLQQLGLTLREIRSVLLEGMPPEGLSELLSEKREACARQIQVERQKLKRLEFQIQIIKGLQSMNIADVQTLHVPPFTAAVIPLRIATNDQVGPALDGAFCRIFDALKTQGLTPSGPCATVWYTTPDDVTDEVVDVLVPVVPAFTPVDDIRFDTLPGVEVAAVTHRGPFDDFQICHVILKEWLAANDCRLGGPYRELYHTPPGPEAVTEVQYAIERITP